MLRVGLTGGLGSGKSTAAQMFAAHGAYILSADEIGRELMQPGQDVYAAIVAHFGKGIVEGDGALNRSALAHIAFQDGRIEELNAIVHPATIARQAEVIEEIRARDSSAVVIIESALIFETKHGGEGFRDRFNKIITVRASEDRKIARFIERSFHKVALSEERVTELAAEAMRRLGQQIDDERKALLADYVITNNGSLEDLQVQADAIWLLLKAEAARPGKTPADSIK
jgi:dephospho-CoA kinase